MAGAWMDGFKIRFEILGKSDTSNFLMDVCLSKITRRISINTQVGFFQKHALFNILSGSFLVNSDSRGLNSSGQKKQKKITHAKLLST